MKSRTKKSKNISDPKSRDKKTLGKSRVFSFEKSKFHTAELDDSLLEDDVPSGGEVYDERYVAFIDILGFKEIIRKSRDVSAQGHWSISSIYSALNLSFDGFEKDYITKFQKSDSDLKVTTFSDFVVISTQTSEAGLDLLIFVVWCVIRDWLSKGYLSRGGITRGNVIHHSSLGTKPGLIFGPAFIEAYVLEQEVADYPRVVFSKDVRSDLNTYQKDEQRTISAIKTLVHRCSDGPQCIDNFGHLRKDGFSFIGDTHEEEALQFNKALLSQLDYGADMPKWYRKTYWLVEKFNEAIRNTAYADKTIFLN